MRKDKAQGVGLHVGNWMGPGGNKVKQKEQGMKSLTAVPGIKRRQASKSGTGFIRPHAFLVQDIDKGSILLLI